MIRVDSNPGVSVVICCYNSAERLPETLRHVSRQSVPEHVPWEVIIVDNASTDASADAARQLWSTYGCRVPFRVVTESIPGVSAARERGFEEADYEFVLFCDDDNWLGADYVRLVYELMMDQPHVGAVGGQGRAVGETALPAWFERYQRYYAVGPQSGSPGTITDAKGYLYGAGLAMRRSILWRLKGLGFRRRLSDRTPGTLTSGGDVELAYLIRLSGYGLCFDPRLEFSHFLPSGRLRWTYLVRLVEGAHRSRAYLDAYLLALSGEADDVGPWRWMAACWKIAWRLLRRPAIVVGGVLGREEGSLASYQWHRWRGEWAAWWTVRSEHRVLCRELVSLRRHLEGGTSREAHETGPSVGTSPVGGAGRWAAVVEAGAAAVADVSAFAVIEKGAAEVAAGASAVGAESFAWRVGAGPDRCRGRSTFDKLHRT